MRICPKCRTAYPARGRATCARDGPPLIEAEEYAASQVDPLIGKTLMGRFVVEERIGTGGMGKVYRAAQTGLARHVALKVLKRELSTDRETVVRFHREAKAMSMLMHANTVRVFDFGEDEEGHLFLAMELLQGELLTAWAEREITPPIGEVVEVVCQILRSLNEAHSKGLIHRDLKPDNIYLARVEGHTRPVVKVLDFGIAKIFRGDERIDELETQAGTVFGTPRYMSPEQAQGKTLDHRSDLYTVGVLLYQLLTGDPPFLDDDAVVVMAKHIRDAPLPVRTVAPEQPIPKSLEAIVTRALAKRPDDRFDNADAFEVALSECLPDVAAEAALGPARISVAGEEPGLPLIPMAIAAAVVLIAVLISGAVVYWASPPEASATTEVLPPPPARVADPGPPVVTRTDVRLTSVPSGAHIFDGEREVGTTPHVFSLAPEVGLRLTLRLDGHEPSDVELRSEAAPSQEVTLTAIPEVAAPPPRARAGRRRRSTPPPEGQASATGPTPYERFD